MKPPRLTIFAAIEGALRYCRSRAMLTLRYIFSSHDTLALVGDEGHKRLTQWECPGDQHNSIQLVSRQYVQPHRNFLFRYVVLAILACNTGCASNARSVSLNTFSLSIQSTEKINPDTNGRASPLKIVFYELKSTAAFEAADFFSLSERDQATLGAELLEKEEFFVQPGETKKIFRNGNPNTTSIGIFAEFRDMDKAVWRAYTQLPAKEVQGLFSSSLSLFKSAPQSLHYQIIVDKKSIRIIQ